MRGLEDIFAQRRPASSSSPTALQVYAGEFTTSASSVDDDMQVRVPGMAEDGDQAAFAAAVWTPRVDDAGSPALPTAGDPAWVVFDDSYDAVVVAWRPA